MILSSPSTAEQRLHGPQSTHEGGGERALSSQPSLPLQQGIRKMAAILLGTWVKINSALWGPENSIL